MTKSLQWLNFFSTNYYNNIFLQFEAGMRKTCLGKDGNSTSLRHVLRNELRAKHRNAQAIGNRQKTQLNHCTNSSISISRGKNLISKFGVFLGNILLAVRSLLLNPRCFGSALYFPVHKRRFSKKMWNICDSIQVLRYPNV